MPEVPPAPDVDYDQILRDLLTNRESRDLGPEQALAQLSKTLATTLDAHQAGLWTLNKATGALDAKFYWDRDTCDAENGVDLPNGTTDRPFSKVDQDQIVAIADIRTDPRWAASAPHAMSSTELRAVLECPCAPPPDQQGW